MKKLALLIIALLSLVSTNAQDKQPKQTQTYNFRRAVELLDDNNEEAASYLEKEIADDAKNGYAYTLLGIINAQEEEYGKALSYIEKAIKFVPKKDEKYMTLALRTKAKIQLELKDTIQACSILSTAINMFPKNTDLIETRGQIYFEQGKYDLSSVDYKKILELDPNTFEGYMGYGRNLVKGKEYEKAKELFSKVIQLYPDYVSGYSFRGETNMLMKKYAEAADDFIKALSIDVSEAKTLSNLQEMADSAETELVSKLKVQSIKDNTSIVWPYYLGIVYKLRADYPQAIQYYKKGLDIETIPVLEKEIADCYKYMFQYDKAIGHIDNAINLDSEDNDLLVSKSNLLHNAKRYSDAIALMDSVIQNNPEFDYGYYLKALYKHSNKDYKGALEDLNLAIAFDPEYTNYYTLRYYINDKLGNKNAVIADCNKIIALDTIPNQNSSAMYAYAALGNHDKAKELLKNIIDNNPKNLAGNYYDAACLYGRMENYTEALSYLRKSLEAGYKEFPHIDTDYDMDVFREMPEYKKLMEEFRPKYEVDENGEEVDEDTNALISAEVPFTKDGGVCKVKCEINGLPLHFIFDTGAAIVSISNVEATFMFKNDYITKQDIITKSNFVDANGDISEGTIINLKKVNFGGLELTNIRASVVHNQKAPLLLGQTVLGRLGRIEIDNDKKVLRISKKEGKK